MNSIYALLQQTEYIFSLALQGLNVVPKVLGTCGHAYAVEFLSPLETGLTSERRHGSDFKNRAILALRILNSLDVLESAMDEEIHQCDMKASHFGVDGEGHVKMLDLDAFGLRSTVQANIASTGHCQIDKDCDFFDCAGRCNASGQCDAVVLNTNLQVNISFPPSMASMAFLFTPRGRATLMRTGYWARCTCMLKASPQHT
ncbi:hypothetical protein HPB48_015476 [Haemaphysalis longicornis]|uniref:FAM69 protein-kinase domain-containing protein n=1 Tax=Haemaphysalis longicornis TaxID=44386 RepID=A0A9J6FHT6_HAELO|nr:hypothetical protein HPB48_015476 [Haemaphysalis longicornis]